MCIGHLLGNQSDTDGKKEEKNKATQHDCKLLTSQGDPYSSERSEK
jgi:hypothetical protein